MAPLHRPVEEDRGRLGEAGRLVIAGLGDSLTFGWMVERAFFDLALDDLEDARRETAISRINAGVPGDTAPGGLWRLAAVLAERPHVVAIQFGLNDCYSGVSAAQFDAAIRRMADAVAAAGAVPLLVTSPPTGLAEGPAAMEPYYGALRALAAERSYPLADIDAAFCALDPAEASSLYQDDDVHPTDEGHELMAEVLFDALAPLV
jgi:acyl-CoA thioesterase I